MTSCYSMEILSQVLDNGLYTAPFIEASRREVLTLDLTMHQTRIAATLCRLPRSYSHPELKRSQRTTWLDPNKGRLLHFIPFSSFKRTIKNYKLQRLQLEVQQRADHNHFSSLSNRKSDSAKQWPSGCRLWLEQFKHAFTKEQRHRLKGGQRDCFHG